MIYGGFSDNTGSLRDLEKAVRLTTKALRPHADEFESIVVSGMSGAVVGAPVALRLKKPLVIVRKPGENAHSGAIVGKDDIGPRTLFLDDFVASGETEQRVMKAVAKTKARIAARYEYHHGTYTRTTPV